MMTTRHQKFCEAIAGGMSQIDAYMAAGYKATGAAAKMGACRLAKRPEIRARLKELRSVQADKSEMSRDALRKYLIEVLLTPIGQINRDHRLCQVHKDGADFTEIRMPDKLRAVEQLIKLCGWAEPEKVEIETGDTLAALLERIRR